MRKSVTENVSLAKGSTYLGSKTPVGHILPRLHASETQLCGTRKPVRALYCQC